MFNKITKRTIVLIIVFVVFGTFIIARLIKSNNKDNSNIIYSQHEEYLDNGIELSKLIEECKYIDDITISYIVNDNNIEYTLTNNSNDSVYISNEIEIMVGEDSILLSDTIEGKIELKPFDKKIITIDCTIRQLSQKLGYHIDAEEILIIKPIYVKYDDKKLLGICKS